MTSRSPTIVGESGATLDISNDGPSSAPFQLYYWPSTATDASGLCTAGPPGSDFDGANPWKCTPTAGAPVYYETIGFGPNFGCPQAQLNAMDNSSPDLIGTISNMTAFGDKVIPLGMAWSFRLLSSAWQNQWSDALDNFNYTDLRAFANNVSFHSHILKRIVILVTDGEDSVAAGDYTAYGLPPRARRSGHPHRHSMREHEGGRDHHLRRRAGRLGRHRDRLAERLRDGRSAFLPSHHHGRAAGGLQKHRERFPCTATTASCAIA